MDAYPELVRVAEVPVFDLSCAAAILQARRVSDDSVGVMLAGEGADELFGDYAWHKISKLSEFLTQRVFNLDQEKVSKRLIEASLRVCGLEKPDEQRFQHMENLSGGLTGWNPFYGLNAVCMQQLMCSDFLSLISNYEPYEDIGLNSSWSNGLSGFNRELEISQRVQLPGILLSSKGYRINVNSSDDARYPYLDPDLADFATNLQEDCKHNGNIGKYLLRKVAAKWSPKSTVWRHRDMLRAPFESFAFSKPS